MLDVWVEPDGSWQWKDEDELVEAIELGVFDEAGAAAVRAEGERVIERTPWPTGWRSGARRRSGDHSACRGTGMWSEGEVVTRREVLNDGRCWLEVPVRVVRDDGQLLATYLASGTPFTLPPGPWPTADGLHPWHGRTGWQGHGTLMLQRPGEAYAIFHFWNGPERTFSGWYVNFQEPFRRTATGYDTQDLELDIWIPADGAWSWKDRNTLEDRIAQGRYTRAQVQATLAAGDRVAALLDANEHVVGRVVDLVATAGVGRPARLARAARRDEHIRDRPRRDQSGVRHGT